MRPFRTETRAWLHSTKRTNPVQPVNAAQRKVQYFATRRHRKFGNGKRQKIRPDRCKKCGRAQRRSRYKNARASRFRQKKRRPSMDGHCKNPSGEWEKNGRPFRSAGEGLEQKKKHTADKLRYLLAPAERHSLSKKVKFPWNDIVWFSRSKFGLKPRCITTTCSCVSCCIITPIA